MKKILTSIRAAIGWYFLYEGCIKLFADGGWSGQSDFMVEKMVETGHACPVSTNKVNSRCEMLIK